VTVNPLYRSRRSQHDEALAFEASGVPWIIDERAIRAHGRTLPPRPMTSKVLDPNGRWKYHREDLIHELS
jgi:hypothetical protein